MSEKPQTAAPAFRKEVVRLPDGRELTYYWFSDQAPGSPDQVPAPDPAKKKKER